MHKDASFYNLPAEVFFIFSFLYSSILSFILDFQAITKASPSSETESSNTEFAAS